VKFEHVPYMYRVMGFYILPDHVTKWQALSAPTSCMIYCIVMPPGNCVFRVFDVAVNILWTAFNRPIPGPNPISSLYVRGYTQEVHQELDYANPLSTCQYGYGPTDIIKLFWSINPGNCTRSSWRNFYKCRWTLKARNTDQESPLV